MNYIPITKKDKKDYNPGMLGVHAPFQPHIIAQRLLGSNHKISFVFSAATSCALFWAF